MGLYYCIEIKKCLSPTTILCFDYGGICTLRYYNYHLVLDR